MFNASLRSKREIFSLLQSCRYLNLQLQGQVRIQRGGNWGIPPPPTAGKNTFLLIKQANIQNFSRLRRLSAPQANILFPFFVDRSCYIKKFRRFLGKCCQKFTKNSLFKKNFRLRRLPASQAPLSRLLSCFLRRL